jgi:hypothetical protein
VTKKKFIEFGAIFATIGAGLIALHQEETSLSHKFPHIPSWVYDACLLLGVFIFGAGTLSVIAALMLPTETLRAGWERFFGRVVFVPRRAKRDDLSAIYEFCHKAFDGQVSPVNRMKEWHRINPNIFFLVHRVKKVAGVKTINQLIGYYCLIPLNNKALSFLEDDSFDGTKISKDFVIHSDRLGKRSDLPAAIYIGGIAAVGSAYAKGFVEGELHASLRAERDKGVCLIYSRPVTRKGLKLLKKYGFEPVDPSIEEQLHHIHKYDFASSDDI